MQEGLECSEECLDDEDEDGNLTPKNADTDLVDEHVPEASPAIDADPGETASKQISSENSPDHMQALLAMREQAKDLQDTATVRFLDNRIAEVARLQERPSHAISTHLRQKAVERKQAEAALRCQQEAERERLRTLQQEERTAKLKLEAAKAEKIRGTGFCATESRGGTCSAGGVSGCCEAGSPRTSLPAAFCSQACESCIDVYKVEALHRRAAELGYSHSPGVRRQVGREVAACPRFLGQMPNPGRISAFVTDSVF